MHYETGIRAVLWVTDNCRHQSVTCTVAVVLRVNPICFRGSWSSRISGLPFLVTSCWVFKAETSPRAFPYGSFWDIFFAWKIINLPTKVAEVSWAWGPTAEAAGQWGFSAAQLGGDSLCILWHLSITCFHMLCAWECADLSRLTFFFWPMIQINSLYFIIFHLNSSSHSFKVLKDEKSGM